MKIRLCDQIASAYYDPDLAPGPLRFVSIRVDGILYSFMPVDPTDVVTMNNVLLVLGFTDMVYTWTSPSQAGIWLFTVTQSNRKYQEILYDANPLIETRITNFTAKSNCNWVETAIRGCNDPKAINYNPLATEDDDSCQYEPITDFEKLQCCIGSKEFKFAMALKYGLITQSKFEECMNELLLQQRSFETMASQKQIGTTITPAIISSSATKAKACFDLGQISNSVFIAVTASITGPGTVYNLIDPLDPIFGPGKAPFYATRDAFAAALVNSINVYAASLPVSPTGGWTAMYSTTTKMFCVEAPVVGPAYNGYVLALEFFQERFYLAEEILVTLPDGPLAAATLRQGDYNSSVQKALFVASGGEMLYIDIDPPGIPSSVISFIQIPPQGEAKYLIYNSKTGNILVIIRKLIAAEDGYVRRWSGGVLTNTNLSAPALYSAGLAAVAKGFNALLLDNYMAILQNHGATSFQTGTHWEYIWNEAFVRLASIQDSTLELNDPGLRDILLIQGQDSGTAEYGKSYANAIASFDFASIIFYKWITTSVTILDLSSYIPAPVPFTIVLADPGDDLSYVAGNIVKIIDHDDATNWIIGTVTGYAPNTPGAGFGTLSLNSFSGGPGAGPGPTGPSLYWDVDLNPASPIDKADTTEQYTVTLNTPWAAPAPKFNTNDRITLRKNLLDDYWIIGNVVSSDYISDILGRGIITFTIRDFKHSTALGVINDMIVNTNMPSCGVAMKTNPWDGSIWIADAPGIPFNGIHRIDHNSATQANPTDTATRITYGGPYAIIYPYSLCFVSYQKLVAGVLTDFREMWVVGQFGGIHIYNFDLSTGDMVGGYTVVGTPRASDAVINTGWGGSGIRSIDQNPYNGYVYSGGYGGPGVHAVIIIDPVTRTVMPGTNIVLTSNGLPYVPFVFNEVSKIAYMPEEQVSSVIQAVAAIDYERTVFNEGTLTANGADASSFIADAVVVEEEDNCLTIDENVVLTNRLMEDNCCDDC